MKLGPLRIITEFKKGQPQHDGASGHPNGAAAEDHANGKGSGTSALAESIAVVDQSGVVTWETGRAEDGKAYSRSVLGFDSPLFQQLPEPLQEQSRSHPHLWEYLCDSPLEDLGIPDYKPRLTRDLRRLKNPNLIYPVGGGIFIHIHPDFNDSRDFYKPIEPGMDPGLAVTRKQVEQRLINYVEELKEAKNGEERSAVLLQCLDRICAVKTGFLTRGAIKVTEKELSELKYVMVRDIEGLGILEPLISDKNIEDISCDGVGGIFVEHKIFGGLKAGIYYADNKDLDNFVIKLSEKIGRPVTVREPIVDAVLPDGSRVNIVYGSDVSKRGSNFTIRKFSGVPMSLLDLIDLGTLSYEMAAYLSLMLGAGMNAFISGETASGKTTLLNALTTLINPTYKIVSIEDTAELQVPHPHWTREVVRGSSEDEASVTMFDLLRAALRQRPNEILIGEIRGEEGAIAFQAMQTGHACMATFHASTVERLIQRLTGRPINVPKTYIDNLNLVIIASAVRLADGTPARRVLSINEILGYDTEADSFNFVEVFRWNAAKDTFDFPGYMNCTLLERVVSPRRGLLPQDSRKIYNEIEDRAVIFRKLHERGLTDFYDFYQVLSQSYRQGFLR